MTPSPFLSIVVIGADVAITILLLCGVWSALRAKGKPPNDVRGVVLAAGTILFGWLAVALLAGWLGLFRSAANQAVPYIALAIGIPIVTGAVLLRRSGTIREIVDAVPQNWLVGFQFYRVVGVTFLVLHAFGLLPGIFALPAGYGDAFVGLTALPVAFAYARYRSKHDPLVALWNYLGLADLVIAVATGFLTPPSPFQVFSLEAPNLLIGALPLVMIPIYAVPLSIVLHLASLTKLRHSNARRLRSRLEKQPTDLRQNTSYFRDRTLDGDPSAPAR
jgi:hypothetical protein